MVMMQVFCFLGSHGIVKKSDKGLRGTSEVTPSQGASEKSYA